MCDFTVSLANIGQLLKLSMNFVKKLWNIYDYTYICNNDDKKLKIVKYNI